LFVAYSQPDRPFSAFVASVGGYAIFFFALKSFFSKKEKFLVGVFWFFCVQLFQLSWMATPYYHGMQIYYPYLGCSLCIGLQWGVLSVFFKENLSYYRILGMASFWTLAEYARLFFLCGFPFNPVGQSLSFSLAPLQLASAVGVLGLSFWVVLTNLFVYKWIAEISHKQWGKLPEMSPHLFASNWEDRACMDKPSASLQKDGVADSVEFSSFSRKHDLEKKSMKTILSALTIGLFPYLFGYWNLYTHQRQIENSESFRVALVQTGLYAEEKVEFEDRSNQYLSPLCQWQRILKSLNNPKGEKVDLIVLPESALPHDLFNYHLAFEDIYEMFKGVFDIQEVCFFPKLEYPIAKGRLVTNAFVAQAIANYFQSELIMGTIYHNLNKKISHNSAVHFSPNKTFYQIYHKRVLIPLSEYLPFSFIGSFMAQHGIEHFFDPGKEANLFYGKTLIAPSICYEECFSSIVRDAKVRGAKLLANLSNDVWFPNSRLAKEHFHLGRFRSVENGTPLVRACNTGITAGIDSVGRVIGQLKEKADEDHWFQGVLFLDIPSYNYETIFSRVGNHPTVALSLFFLSTFFIFRKKRRL
jgi:apolipoprotein N-acyltransferase